MLGQTHSEKKLTAQSQCILLMMQHCENSFGVKKSITHSRDMKLSNDPLLSNILLPHAATLTLCKLCGTIKIVHYFLFFSQETWFIICMSARGLSGSIGNIWCFGVFAKITNAVMRTGRSYIALKIPILHRLCNIS